MKKTIPVTITLTGIFILLLLAPAFSYSYPAPTRQSADPYESYMAIKYRMNLEQFDKAKHLIDRFLKNHPDDPFILTEKAVVAMKQDGSSYIAEALLEKARAIYPDYYYSNYLLAYVLFSSYPDITRKVDKALQCLMTAIRDNREFYDSYYWMGVILNDRGRHAESNRYFEKANRLDQKPASYYYMASNYRKLKDESGEIATYKSLLSLSPGNFKAISTLAQIYMTREDYAGAAVYLEKLFAANPGSRRISAQYLYSLFASGQDKKFIEVSGQTDIRDSPLLVYAKALILYREKRFNEAIAFLDSIETKDLKARLLLSELHMQKQDYFRSYQVLKNIEAKERTYPYYAMKLQVLTLLNLNERIVNLFDHFRKNTAITSRLTVSDYYNVLYAYSNLNRLKNNREASRFLEDQIKTKSLVLTGLLRRLGNFSIREESAVVNNSGSGLSPTIFLTLTFYKNQSRHRQAADVLERMIKKGNAGEGPYLELCDIYMEQEQFEKAGRCLETMRKRFPKSTMVKNFYAYFLAMQSKDLEHALELSAETLKEDQDNPAYLDTYGYILLKSGRFAEAGSFLEKAHRKHPFEPEIMEHLADYYRWKKENRKIIGMYRKAIDNGVDFKDRLIEKLKKLESKPLR
ncbi:MAG: tetratricopeptide repeat protein [bacterium]|nr:tetratricopeptide repeat protein [bacterium]